MHTARIAGAGLAVWLLSSAPAGRAAERLSLAPLLTESAVTSLYATATVACSNAVVLKATGQARFPWVSLAVPNGTLDLSAYRLVTADIENRGPVRVTASLWVCAAGGWQPVDHTLKLAPGQKAAFQVDLRRTWSDQTPRLDPRRITHVQLVLCEPAAGAEVRLSGLAATGAAGPFVAPTDRLVVPDLTEGQPAPGRRVKEQLPAYRNTGLYHALYLPTDWKPGERYPVIVEYPGNEWFLGCYSTGLPENGRMGYGMSQGRGCIWVNAPCVNRARQAVQRFGWDEAATAEYGIALVRWVCENYGGDPGAVLLTGFSRGGLACTGIGLYNEATADVWLAFHACQGFESSPEALRERMPRLHGRAVFHTDNGRPDVQKMFEPFRAPVVWAKSGLGYHSDVMLLDQRPSTVALRQWMQDVMAKRPGTYSVSGAVRNARGGAAAGLRVESGTHFTFTDAAGRYALRGLIAGPRTLAVLRPAGPPVERAITIDGKDAATVDFVVE